MSDQIQDPPQEPIEPREPAPQTDNPQPVESPSRPPQQQQQRDRRMNRGQQRHSPRPQRDQRPQDASRQPRERHSNAVSVVIPLLNEELSLKELYENLRAVLNRSGNYELIFVDDGSTDGSVRILQELRGRDHRVKIIRFRRNYGKSAALSVGFQQAKSEIVITMDADLQDDPREIPNLVNEIKKGYDLVSGWKKKRFDPITKTIPSKFFNAVTALLTGIPLHDFNCGLKAYRREVLKELHLYGELHRYIPVLAHWRGFKVSEIVVQHHPRKYGKTKFGMGRFWKGFLDLLTVLFTTRYLQRPLHLFGFVGLVFFLLGVGIDSYLVFLKFMEGMSLSNRPLFLGGVLLIIVGIQFISVGLLGELIAKTRPPSTEEYSIRESWK